MLLWLIVVKICAIIVLEVRKVSKLEIVSLDHQGRGIGKIDSKTIFVPNALPGEVVDIDITVSKKNYCEAIVNKVLQKTTDRIEPICPYFSICGGCDLLHMPYEKQIKYKNNKIENIMKRFCKANFVIKDIIPSTNFHYRNKVTYHVKNGIGFYKEKSNELIEIDTCFLADKKIDSLYDLIRKNANLKNIESIVIRAAYYTDDVMAVLETNNAIDEKEWIALLQDKVSSIIVNDKKIFKTIYGKSFMVEKLLDCEFMMSNDAFFQVNTIQAEKLYQKVLEYADIKDTETVLDLYCGTGTIGILASKYAKKVIGIEINEDAVKSANKNKELNGIKNTQFYAGDTGKILSTHHYKVDTVIVDPPRAGLNNQAIDEILAIAPKKIVYVSCDPMTLARDLNILSENYDIKELTPVDMFPNTAHVESVTLLILKEVIK